MGLLLASIMSVTNVLTDVWRKRALEKRDLFSVTLWMRVAVAAVFCAVLLVRIATGHPVVIRDVPAFAMYLVVDVSLITVVMWLYFRALQVSPMSLCIPFLAFTPVFLIPTTYIVLGQQPNPVKLIGVLLIVVGSLAMHRTLFAEGWLAPVRAVINEKGSRYMLLVSFIFSLTNPIDKKLVDLSDVYFEAVAYGLGLVISFYLLARSRHSDFAAAARGNVRWIALAGLFDAISLLFQLASYTYLAVVITVSIKRAGIVLSVLAGWLFFGEREITDKVIAASVMFCGVLILYLPMDLTQSLAFLVATLVGMTVALYASRRRAA